MANTLSDKLEEDKPTNKRFNLFFAGAGIFLSSLTFVSLSFPSMYDSEETRKSIEEGVAYLGLAGALTAYYGIVRAEGHKSR